MDHKKRDKLVTSESAKIKQRRKNGVWYDIMSKITGFLMIRREVESTEESQEVASKVKSVRIKQSLMKGTVAAGALAGGLFMMPEVALADELDLENEDTLIGQDTITLNTARETPVSELEMQDAAESDATSTSASVSVPESTSAALIEEDETESVSSEEIPESENTSETVSENGSEAGSESTSEETSESESGLRNTENTSESASEMESEPFRIGVCFRVCEPLGIGVCLRISKPFRIRICLRV